jgi:DnaJ-class molecular chaperone
MNESPTEPTKICPDCDGVGSYSSFSEDGCFEDSWLCPTCDGEGVVPAEYEPDDSE